METQKALGPAARFTFKGNHKETRYGWLRLTPAYSVHLVIELLDLHASKDTLVLDPFCGTGTTALACAERGIACDTTDINPLLLWLTQAKTHTYNKNDLAEFEVASAQIVEAILAVKEDNTWLPLLHQIEKWWDEATLRALGRAMCKIKGLLRESASTKVIDLLKIIFCRVAIGHANVSFGHQSMSFKKRSEDQALPFPLSAEHALATTWRHAALSIIVAASSPVRKQPRVILCDARHLSVKLEADHYACVITSPPYPNRMSYIRELRPYMYWLGYLHDQRAAGELDWQAIGGTWGCATSNVAKWKPDSDLKIPFAGFDEILTRIAQRSPLLSRYVHKYFYDMAMHCDELFRVIKPGGIINYIVGNSKFYDVMLPVEEIYAALFRDVGFDSVEVRSIRKRTSKKELFEFIVSARKPLQ